jgi:ribonuclease PH
VAAVSIGKLGSSVLLDLDYEEDSGCDADVNVVMTDADQLVEIQGTAEGNTFSRQELNALIDSAQAGIQQLHRAQRAAVERA